MLAKIATIMGERNVDILAGHIQCSDDKLTGYDLFYVEMADAKVTPQELVDALKALDFVEDVQIEPKSKVKFETMMFPLPAQGTRVCSSYQRTAGLRSSTPYSAPSAPQEG